MTPRPHAAALIRAREAIVGTDEIVRGTKVRDEDLDTQGKELDRLFRMAPAHREDALGFELAETLAFSADETSATLSARTRTGTTPTVTLVRPNARVLNEGLTLIAGYADLRADRSPEITAQLTDLLSFHGSILSLAPARTPRTLELARMTMAWVAMAGHRLKLSLGVVRPIVLSPQVQPIIQTPTHGAYPSNHAVQAFATATVLADVSNADDQTREQLMRMAARIAINRTVAGVHYPVDSGAGAITGTALAGLLRARAGFGDMPRHHHFDGTGWTGDTDMGEGVAGARDFHREALRHVMDGNAPLTLTAAQGDPQPAPLLGKLWQDAAAEWAM